jgi:hypothetical protein
MAEHNGNAVSDAYVSELSLEHMASSSSTRWSRPMRAVESVRIWPVLSHERLGKFRGSELHGELQNQREAPGS